MPNLFTVTSAGLNIHSGPRATAHILDTLTTGDRMTIVDTKDHWLYGQVVHTKSGLSIGEVGWVDSHFGDLKVVSDQHVPLPHVWPEPVPPPKSLAWVWLVAVIVLAAIVFIAFGVLGWKPPR